LSIDGVATLHSKTFGVLTLLEQRLVAVGTTAEIQSVVTNEGGVALEYSVICKGRQVWHDNLHIGYPMNTMYITMVTLFDLFFSQRFRAHSIWRGRDGVLCAEVEILAEDNGACLRSRGVRCVDPGLLYRPPHLAHASRALSSASVPANGDAAPLCALPLKHLINTFLHIVLQQVQSLCAL
jgi:hypothetical protein